MSDSDDSSQWTDEDEEDEDEEEENEWKDVIRKKMEDELARRVADALPETPPMERLRRRQEAAKKAQEYDQEDLNAHLDFSEEFYQKRQQEELSEIKGRFFVDPGWKREKPEEEAMEEESTEVEDKTAKESNRQYQFYASQPIHLQHYGVVGGTNSTSFDANSIVPLLPHPRHLHIIPKDPEPLYSPIKFVIGSRTYENQVTQFTHKLRGSGVVYDSQKSPKKQKVEVPTNPLIAPNLVFEARFECGNLRQARRVGQFEYELVLKTDMFTKRHTQWFYFRVQNMVPGIIYKFRIVNLLKKDSLYNYGMRPLLYSERKASERTQGWIRHGHHISYGRNVQHLLSSLLSREMAYYELEWQMEFPYLNDTCYLAHCYPFSHTDLKNDIALLQANEQHKSFIKEEIMCETRAGHPCHLLTITNFAKNHCNKKCVVVSARVHPGESNSSWMMKGLYEFLVSDHPEAKELRDHFVFKLVPMLNPDGVIVGNYRCSLQAKDLNRNYRWPRLERFPTIWHVKNLVQTVQQETDVFVYCDFHGHSRKSNVFMYGNSTSNDFKGNDPNSSVKDFLNERMLPFMISQLDPEMFNFDSSRFAIRKCKESTGRVVMYRQHKIVNSFTMEATFSGTKVDQNGARHYNQQDFMDTGALFARGVLHYAKVIEDKQKESEAFLDLAKNITQQVLNNSIRQKLSKTIKEGAGEGESGEITGAAGNPTTATADSENGQVESRPAADDSNVVNNKAGAKELYTSEPGISISDAKAAMNQLKSINTDTKDSVEECFKLLQNLSLSTNIGSAVSDSSDSDSESEPEMIDEKNKKKKKKNKNNNKKKKDGKRQTKNLSNINPDYVLKNFKPAASRAPAKGSGATNGRSTTSNGTTSGSKSGQALLSSKATQENSAGLTGLKVLPAIGGEQEVTLGSNSKLVLSAKANANITVDPFGDGPGKLPSNWANPYQHRSNGGIPCYSEERSLERAAKKMAEIQRKVEERVKKQQQTFIPYSQPDEYTPEFDLDLQELNALKLQKKHVQDSFNKSIRMLAQSCVPDIGYFTGRLEGSVVTYDSEFVEATNLRRRKKKAPTPINDSYATAHTDYSSPRDTWQWYPRDSTHGRERPPAHLTAMRDSQDINGTKAREQSQSRRTQPSSTKPVTQRHHPENTKSLFPPAKFGQMPRAPQTSRLKNVLKVNPLHYQNNYE